MDELKPAGIEPFATLYHWDLPQALQDKYGGWQSAETAKAFGEYGGYVAKSLGDRVFPCRLTSVSRIAFQACPFNHPVTASSVSNAVGDTLIFTHAWLDLHAT